jgi:hypothetical protein
MAIPLSLPARSNRSDDGSSAISGSHHHMIARSKRGAGVISAEMTPAPFPGYCANTSTMPTPVAPPTPETTAV